MGEGKSYVPEANFTSLVLTLSSSAWVALGKIADPVSGEIKKDLRGAKLTIDLLIMLRDKTRGNLSGDEEKLLNAIISDLQGNYAETVFEESKEEKASTAETTSSGSASKDSKGESLQDKMGESNRKEEKAVKENAEDKNNINHGKEV
ncbi:MAG: DUF1844 domain-containing protein [Spirochaetota bacterium]